MKIILHVLLLAYIPLVAVKARFGGKLAFFVLLQNYANKLNMMGDGCPKALPLCSGSLDYP
jgi:hypothetical protein